MCLGIRRDDCARMQIHRQCSIAILRQPRGCQMAVTRGRARPCTMLPTEEPRALPVSPENIACANGTAPDRFVSYGRQGVRYYPPVLQFKDTVLQKYPDV